MVRFDEIMTRFFLPRWQVLIRIFPNLLRWLGVPYLHRMWVRNRRWLFPLTTTGFFLVSVLILAIIFGATSRSDRHHDGCVSTLNSSCFFQGNLTPHHHSADALDYSTNVHTSGGLGDLVPARPWTKGVTCFFAMLLMVVIDVKISQAAVIILSSVPNLPSKRVCRIISYTIVSLFILLGAFVFRFFEATSWGNSFYASIIAFTTEGFGDFPFTSLYGRIFGAIWMIFSKFGLEMALTLRRCALCDEENMRKTIDFVARLLVRDDLTDEVRRLTEVEYRGILHLLPVHVQPLLLTNRPQGNAPLQGNEPPLVQANVPLQGNEPPLVQANVSLQGNEPPAQ